MTGRIVCHFSCGAASAVATKLAVESYPPDQVLILNAYVAAEHPDNRRFLADCEKWFGLPITVVSDEKYNADPYEIFRRTRFTKSRNGAKCSQILKGAVLDAISLPTDIHVLGYTFEEQDRVDKYADANNGRRFIVPLINQELTKADCLAMIQNAGIELPLMYRMGYNNASCIGCVKGGAGYWNKIRVDFPAQFADMVRIEELIGPTSYLFRDRKTNQRVPLSALPHDAGNHKEPDISCSSACEMVEQLIDMNEGDIDMAGHIQVGVAPWKKSQTVMEFDEGTLCE